MNLLEQCRSTLWAPTMSCRPSDWAHAVLLVVSTIYSTQGLLPPHAASKSERWKRDWLAPTASVAPYAARALLVSASIFQAYTVVLLKPGVTWSGRTQLLNAVCCLTSCFGGWLRLRCYRELGRFFTFAIGIRKEHKVIQTGPYRYVRHPSYTALSILLLSQALVHLAASPAAGLLELQQRLVLTAGACLGPAVLFGAAAPS
ncbi:uncharacterized protein PSFLO_04173 [Pseudozyma flocculosa]|uniref:Protein-S-isoprenylcysteine O-methyltransferase n=1 Tax=Pseudozyma flocculosa TaxID=84751 RepID=A0A5C3F2I3_9BASI|nr:uncharacterized protein PSFLO_04173 [Pseudozyma flocculosa]